MTEKMDLSLGLFAKLSQWRFMNIDDVVAPGKAVCNPRKEKSLRVFKHGATEDY